MPMEKIKNAKQISIHIPKEWLQFLREIAHKKSIEEKGEISANDIIRRSIIKSYPTIEDYKES